MKTRMEVVGEKKKLGTRIKEKFEDVCDYTKEWWSENKDWAVVVLPVVSVIGTKLIGSTLGVAKATINADSIKKEEETKRRRFYERATGSYVYITRDLTGYELKQVTARHDDGERYVNIFSDMGILR